MEPIRFPYPAHILQFTHEYFTQEFTDACGLGPWDFLGDDGTTYSYPSGFHRRTTPPPHYPLKHPPPPPPHPDLEEEDVGASGYNGEEVMEVEASGDNEEEQ